MRQFLLSTCLLFSGMAALSAGNILTESVSFYSATVNIRYDDALLSWHYSAPDERSIRNIYRAMGQTQYQVLRNDLLSLKEKWRLNDWLYFELVQTVGKSLMSGQSEAKKVLFAWFLLSESGFDTRLAYRENDFFLYVYSQDEVYEAPLIEENGRTFVNLSSIRSGGEKQQPVMLIAFAPQVNGRPFSFSLHQLPLLPPLIGERMLFFRHDNQTYSLKALSDRTLVQIMSRYPLIHEREYLEAPLSPTLQGSLLPQLRQLIQGKPPQEALGILACFTRTCFRYKEDLDFFGFSKPMIADELFNYAYSDCEDRSALFFNLVKELLGMPMIIVAFPDHLTIAVALQEAVGDPILFNGKRYYICDPTGPAGSVEIGDYPEDLKGQPFEILGSFR